MQVHKLWLDLIQKYFENLETIRKFIFKICIRICFSYKKSLLKSNVDIGIINNKHRFTCTVFITHFIQKKRLC